MKKIKIVIEKTSTGFSAYAANCPVYTTGENVKALTDNIREALSFYFEEVSWYKNGIYISIVFMY